MGEIKDKIYRIYIHTGNEYSIYENEYQVAAIKRSPWKRRNADKYIIEFQRTVPIHLISIITIILDLETYPDDMNVSKLSYNTNWEINGKKKDRNWKASH